MVHRSSFSQHSLFEKCNRWWYFEKVEKLFIERDLTYAHAGKAIHNTLEGYYNGKFSNLEETKEFFKQEWSKFKLPQTKLKFKQDEYWLMVLNGVKYGLAVTSTELKIYYPDAIGYLDIVNTADDEIGDWKSSRRTAENEKEYRRQGMIYAWLYQRKFNRLPKKVTFYYLRYNGTRGTLVFEPTEDDVMETQMWYDNILNEMAEVKQKGVRPPMCAVCDMWCPFVDMCNANESELKFKLYYTGSMLYLEGPISAILNKGLDNKFSYELKNAHWILKANPNARTTVRFWDYRRRLLPIGFKQGVLKTLRDYGLKYNKKVFVEHIEKRVFTPKKLKLPDKFLDGKVLRDYQNDAVDVFLKNKIGILEIGTGGGKTEIAIEVIRRLGVRTLFLVDKIELLRQTKKRIESALGIPVGQLGAGVDDLKEITVATIQTVVKHLKKYAPYLRTVRLAIFDETHKVAALSYVRVGRQLTTSEYRLGISGTAFRDDGEDMRIWSVTGYNVFDLGSAKLIEMGWLTKPTIRFIKNYISPQRIRDVEDGMKTGLINETFSYSDYYEQFIHLSLERNVVVQDIVNENEGKKILILTKLIDHGKLLTQLTGGRHLYGGTSKKERKEIFDDFTEGSLNILVSTLSIFSEGIDVPDLDIVINAGANKGFVKTIQVLGRVLRKIEGKENAFYVDFFDDIKYLGNASRARKKALISEGHEVNFIDWQKANKAENN